MKKRMFKNWKIERNHGKVKKKKDICECNVNGRCSLCHCCNRLAAIRAARLYNETIVAFKTIMMAISMLLTSKQFFLLLFRAFAISISLSHSCLNFLILCFVFFVCRYIFSVWSIRFLCHRVFFFFSSFDEHAIMYAARMLRVDRRHSNDAFRELRLDKTDAMVCCLCVSMSMSLSVCVCITLYASGRKMSAT